MRALVPIVRAVLAAFPALGVVAQQPEVGDPAPSIALDAWLNTEDSPTLEKLRGRVVMLEFWGTWCAPCVRSMPHVQELHDRYGNNGLTVLAISYETPDQMQGFLREHAYTMRVGSDPKRKVVGAYGVRGWPSTVIVNQEGEIAYVGGPYGAEAAVEAALGLESSPASTLTAYLSVLADSSNAELRDSLERLVHKATADFDLKAWAAAMGGTEPAAGAKKLTGDKALAQCVDAWRKGDVEARQAVLDHLAARAPGSFNLKSWARAAYGKQYPIKPKELAELLDQGKFDAAISAVLDRTPSARLLATAARHEEFRDFCRKRAPESRTLAKKGVMISNWLFGEFQIEEEDNEAFWRELSVSGISTSKDKKSIEGVLIGGKAVTRAMAPYFVDEQLARALVMEKFASRKAPKLRQLDSSVEKERAKIEKPLIREYGTKKKTSGK